jgi:hypothetical protein
MQAFVTLLYIKRWQKKKRRKDVNEYWLPEMVDVVPEIWGMLPQDKPHPLVLPQEVDEYPPSVTQSSSVVYHHLNANTFSFNK